MRFCGGLQGSFMFLSATIRWILKILHDPYTLYLGNYGAIVCPGHAGSLISTVVPFSPWINQGYPHYEWVTGEPRCLYLG